MKKKLVPFETVKNPKNPNILGFIVLRLKSAARAPPAPAPIHAVKKGRIRGNVTVYTSGSSIPNILTGRALLIIFFIFLFFVLMNIATAAPI